MREIVIRQFFEDISPLLYVVQRNWENLPQDYAVDGHDDLDLFCTDDAKPRIKHVLEKYPEIHCDVRSPEDDYYPQDLGNRMLSHRLYKDGFFIPADQEAFDALFYHNLIHKADNPYGAKLAQMFKTMYPPVKCKDAGVGFYDNN